MGRFEFQYHNVVNCNSSRTLFDNNLIF